HHAVVPNASDLKSDRDSDVRVKITVDQHGSVVCAKGTEGDTALFQRSEEASRRWTFRPYLLNGNPIIVESSFVFHFHKGKASVRFR
ncbi:MAG: hypothetical protein ACRD4I_12330, partial [Candidatus Angelobacter sp.]